MGSYSTPASKSQDSADVPVKMTFRDQTALKLSASHYFSTWLLNVILRGISALRCLLAAAWVQSPCFSFQITGAPWHCMDICWQAWVQSCARTPNPPTHNPPSQNKVRQCESPQNRKTCRKARDYSGTTYLHTYLPTNLPTYLHTYIHTYTYIYIYAYTNIYIYICIHMCIHIHI